MKKHQNELIFYCLYTWAGTLGEFYATIKVKQKLKLYVF